MGDIGRSVRVGGGNLPLRVGASVPHAGAALHVPHPYKERGICGQVVRRCVRECRLGVGARGRVGSGQQVGTQAESFSAPSASV